MQTKRSRDLIKFLLECQALKFGDFTLKSGAKSPFFIDLGNVRSGRQLDTLGVFMAEAIQQQFPETTIVFGPAYKGIALAVAAAAVSWRIYQHDIGVVFDRKEAKGHGEGGTYIGQLPGAGDRVLLIDDVLTSGLTKRLSIERLQQAFALEVVDILVIVDRRGKSSEINDELRFSSLLDLHILSAYLASEGDARAELIQKWWETA